MDVKIQNNILEMLLHHTGTSTSPLMSATLNPASSSTVLDRNTEIPSLISSSSKQKDNMQGLPLIRRLPRTYLEEGGRRNRHLIKLLRANLSAPKGERTSASRPWRIAPTSPPEGVCRCSRSAAGPAWLVKATRAGPDGRTDPLRHRRLYTYSPSRVATHTRTAGQWDRSCPRHPGGAVVVLHLRVQMSP